MRTTPNKNNHSILSSLLNAAGGFFLMIKNPFEKGDFIELGGKIGSVTKKSFYSSEIKTIEGENISLGHSQFLFEKLNNLSNQNIIRLELTVNVCYSENMGKVKTAVNNFLNAQSAVLKSPKLKIAVSKLHQNHVELIVSPWCSLNDFLELDYKLENTLADFLKQQGFKMQLPIEEYEEKREFA